MDWAAAVDRAQAVVAGCADSEPEELIDGGAMLVARAGRFVDPHTVAVGDRHPYGESVVMVTGAMLPRLPVEGIELADRHVELLEAFQLPDRLEVVGGGVIGMEFAFMTARVGVEVSVVKLVDHVLGRADQDVRREVAAMAERLGIALHLSTRVERLVGDENGIVVEAMSPDGPLQLASEQVLLAAGMVPAVEDLALEAAGVAYDHHGIPTDPTLRTNVAHIYAIGDVRAGAYQLSPIATKRGMMAAGNALRGEQVAFDDRVVPYLVGLTPPVAGVGLTEDQARDQGLPVEVHRQGYKDICPVGNVVGELEGFVKVVAETGSGRTLGAHAVGAGSPELIQGVAFAMTGNLTLAQAAGTLSVFPGLSQVLRYALMPKPIHDPPYVPRRPPGA